MERAIKRRLGREFWQESLKDQAGSGLTVSEFCDKHALQAATFYSWRKRLGEAKESPARVVFTPISIKDPFSIGVELLLPGGLVLRFSGLAPVEYLRQLSAAYVVL